MDFYYCLKFLLNFDFLYDYKNKNKNKQVINYTLREAKEALSYYNEVLNLGVIICSILVTV